MWPVFPFFDGTGPKRKRRKRDGRVFLSGSKQGIPFYVYLCVPLRYYVTA